MRFPVIRALPVAAFFLLISGSAQAQLSAEAPRFPRIADISDLAFESEGSFANHAASTGLPEGQHLEYQTLDTDDQVALAPAGAMLPTSSPATYRAKRNSTLGQGRMGPGPTLVTVPAGTFSCYSVESHDELPAISQPGLKAKSSKQVDYYDPAIGLIKTDYYDNNGKLLQSRVLSKR